MLDKDQDGHLTEDEILSVFVDVVDEAFGRTPPGEVGTGNEFLPLKRIMGEETDLLGSFHHGVIGP